MIARINKPTIRAAVYTRVSTEEGLDQDFNSLDAQREAGEAFILSQSSEGWTCLADRYDDGGFSGGNLNRPALERLIADIREEKIDCVVTYKVDRLSRSLLDFARLMEEFEKHNVSYVSVTQQINSASSMGRLILNVLLSFAQFEREIIAERTRDKMRAAKRRGKWIGGKPPLGYDLSEAGRRLEVNDVEAEQVKQLYQAYLERHSITQTLVAAQEKQIRNKKWLTKSGRIVGGDPFSKSSLQRLLTNPIYTGRVSLGDETHDGEHSRIVDQELFDAVQTALAENKRSKTIPRSSKYSPLLKGILRCSSCGRGMIHSSTRKAPNRVYRYYVCGKAMKEGWNSCSTKSVPATEMENLVVEQLSRIQQNQSLRDATRKNAKELRKQEQSAIQERIRIRQNTRRQLQKQLRTAIKDQGNPLRIQFLEDQASENELHLKEEESALESLQRLNDAWDDHANDSFSSVWAALSPSERRRITQILLEGVYYDGSTGLVSFRFKQTSLREDLVENE